MESIEATFGAIDDIDNDILPEIEVAEPRKRKVYFRDVDPFHDYSEDCFKKRFRFSKSVVMNVILPRITLSLQSETQRGLPETETIIIVSSFGAAWLLVFVMAAVLCVRLRSLRNTVEEMQATNRIRVQKLKINKDKNHAFHNPALSPDEELSRRGYSMYAPDDVESSRHSDRQTGGQLVEELSRELDARQQRQSAPPFLLQAIEENKRRTRSNNPVANANGRQSDTNPNFIY